MGLALGSGNRTAGRAGKRRAAAAARDILDFVLAAVLLLALLPLVAAAAAAIRVGSPGPVIFRQRRVGWGGREFVIYKLRTMRVDAENESGPVLARDGDERVTRAGRILRATRIDEIPQLVNVLNGDMRLVGPRPERPELAREFVRAIPRYAERWSVKPGITGLAQVRAGYHGSPEEKLRYDLDYVERRSPALDLAILAETALAVATGRGV